jgi:hypothetical protein
VEVRLALAYPKKLKEQTLNLLIKLLIDFSNMERNISREESRNKMILLKTLAHSSQTQIRILALIVVSTLVHCKKLKRVTT